MRRHVMRLLALALVMSVPLTGLVAGAGAQESTEADELRASFGLQSVAKRSPSQAAVQGDARPRGANPYLSNLPPDQKVDWFYWRELVSRRGQIQAQADAAARVAAPTAVVPVDEGEPDELRGLNDETLTAQPIPGFGTGEGEDPEAEIEGTLAPLPTAAEIGPFPEDDGSIPLANPTTLSAETETVSTSGVVGDGPYGSAGTGSGDFDFFSVEDVEAGQTLSVDISASEAGSTLDSVVIIWDSQGIPLALSDDDGETFDSLLTYTFTAPGDYYVEIAGFFGEFPADPFDSSSGFGFGSEGPYSVVFGLDAGDRDGYSFELDAGDVFSATVDDDAARIQLLDPEGQEVIGSAQDFTGIHPENTELVGGGNAALGHVAATSGRYVLFVTQGEGDYEARLRVRRPPLETAEPGATQALFVDFDGEELNTGIFGGRGVTTLSPLSAFLGGWGIPASDEDAVIDAILASIEESLSADLRVKGNNGDFDATGEPGDYDVEILNSRDDPDPFGQDNVSRVIVGGTIEESGVPTIGIAQSIDIGNFDAEETALVLLDLMSSQEPVVSLNDYVGPETDIIEFVGTAVGNVTTHEAGHFFGNWHVDPLNPAFNIMDSGRGLPGLYGVGEDLIFGTEDDPDVDFGEDAFEPVEGFTGIEDTLNTVAFGLSTGETTEATAPTGVAAVGYRRLAVVSWVPPAQDGGEAITGYVVRVYDPAGALVRSVEAAAPPLVIRGLRRGGTYTFTVSAVNALGESAESAPSAPLTIRPSGGSGGGTAVP